MGSGDDDHEDVAEQGHWSCGCGASGTCVEGDELAALFVHVTLAHPVDDE
jgi:hypothetical protein